MKILWLTRNYDREYYNCTRDFIYSVANVVDVDIVWRTVNIDFINEYDVVILYCLWEYSNIQWKNVTSIKCLIAEDGQYIKSNSNFKKNNSYKTLKMATRYFDYAFIRSPLAWKKLWPRTNFKNTFPFINCINTDIIKDYGETKDIDISLIGSVNRQYPIRYEMSKLFKNHENFRFVNKKYNPIFDGAEYSKFLNRSKISCSCSSIYQYTVAKCFEIPGSMTALLSDLTPDMKNLGFEDGMNMIEYDNDVEEKVDYYLNNPKELNILTRNGYQLIRDNHTTEIRVKEFLGHLEKIMSNEEIIGKKR